MSQDTDLTQALPAPDYETAFASAFAERAKDPEARQTDGLEPSTTEPAPARSDEAPAVAAVDVSASGEAQSFDPWAGLTPEQKALLDRIQSSERSQRGRVGALTKKLNGIERERATAPSQTKSEDEGGDGANPDDADLARITEEYGDVVGPIVKRLEAIQGKIDAIDLTSTTRDEVNADAEEMTQAFATLERDHPDFMQIAQDQNFENWKSAQTPKVQALSESYDPGEVSLVLTKFKAERSAAMAMQSGQDSDQGIQEGSATDDRRQRQLEGSKAVTTRGAPAAAGVPNDFSSAFKARTAATAP